MKSATSVCIFRTPLTQNHLHLIHDRRNLVDVMRNKIKAMLIDVVAAEAGIERQIIGMKTSVGLEAEAKVSVLDQRAYVKKFNNSHLIGRFVSTEFHLIKVGGALSTNMSN